MSSERMIQHHVDHRRHEQGEIDLLAFDGLEHRLGIKTLQHVHGAAAHQRRQHLRARDVADRRHRQVARGIRNFEIGQDRAGPSRHTRDDGAARPWICRSCRRCSSAWRYRPGRRSCAPWRCRPLRSPAADRRRNRPGPSVKTVFKPDGLRGELAAAIAERHAVDHQHLRFGIFQLKQLIVQRTQRMQPGDRKPRQLRGSRRRTRCRRGWR